MEKELYDSESEVDELQLKIARFFALANRENDIEDERARFTQFRQASEKEIRELRLKVMDLETEVETLQANKGSEVSGDEDSVSSAMQLVGGRRMHGTVIMKRSGKNDDQEDNEDFRRKVSPVRLIPKES